MKRIKLVGLLGSFILVLSMMMSCKSTAKLTATLSDLNGEWNIMTLNGKTPNSEKAPFIGIDATTERLFGYAGCNRIMGQVEYPNSNKMNIRFINVATTRMACPDMTEEQELLKTLSNISRFEVDGNTKPITKITLFDMKGNPVITLKKK